MHTPLKRLALLAALVAALPAALLAADAPTVESLIEKNLETRGGRGALEAVDSARLTGTMNVQGMELPMTLEWKAPAKFRLEMSFQGSAIVQAYDGTTGWMINPMMGTAAAEKMSAEDTAQAKEQADFHGPLLNPKEKGFTVEYMGEEEIEGTPAHKLKITNDATGDVTYTFLDTEYFLEIKSQTKRTTRGQEIEADTSIGDYKEVGGLMMAHSMDATMSGGMGAWTMTIEKVELDVDLPDSRFEMPAAEAKEDGGASGGR